MSSRACRLIASTTTGGEWPRQLTAQPCTKSRYRFPLWSHNQEPSPLTNTVGGRVVISISACVACVCRFMERFFLGLDRGYGPHARVAAVSERGCGRNGLTIRFVGADGTRNGPCYANAANSRRLGEPYFVCQGGLGTDREPQNEKTALRGRGIETIYNVSS